MHINKNNFFKLEQGKNFYFLGYLCVALGSCVYCYLWIAQYFVLSLKPFL